MSSKPLIVALDHPTAAQALALARRLDPQACRVKVASTLFVRAGNALIEQLQSIGFDVFLDLKFHDIPNQVAGACRAAAELGVWMVTVHAAGGRAMMRAAVQALSAYSQRPRVVGVTVLTSLDAADLEMVGMGAAPAAAAGRLGALACEAGLDGIVCSPQELIQLRPQLPPPFLMVTPGIRLAEGGSGRDDQKRVTTPHQATTWGADYLVVGRPITEAADPLAVVQMITRDLNLVPPPG